ncbi:hypothetical protein [Streptomyces sp. NPDC002913]
MQATYLDELAPTRRNIISATEAYARLAVQGWQPVTGYPGSDSLWTVRCQLCDWTGERFYSHLRRGRPLNRHPECLPVDQHADRITKLNADASSWCDCPTEHVTTPDDVAAVMAAADQARTAADDAAMAALLGRLLDPCTATAVRAAAMRQYATHGNQPPKITHSA